MKTSTAEKKIWLCRPLKISTASKFFWLCRLLKTSTAKSFFWLWKSEYLILAVESVRTPEIMLDLDNFEKMFDLVVEQLTPVCKLTAVQLKR